MATVFLSLSLYAAGDAFFFCCCYATAADAAREKCRRHASSRACRHYSRRDESRATAPTMTRAQCAVTPRRDMAHHCRPYAPRQIRSPPAHRPRVTSARNIFHMRQRTVFTTSRAPRYFPLMKSLMECYDAAGAICRHADIIDMIYVDMLLIFRLRCSRRFPMRARLCRLLPLRASHDAAYAMMRHTPRACLP